MKTNNLKYVLEIGELDFKVLHFLQQNKDNSFSKLEVAKKFKKDRTTIHKSIARLEKKFFVVPLIIDKKLSYPSKFKVNEALEEVMNNLIDDYQDNLIKEALNFLHK